MNEFKAGDRVRITKTAPGAAPEYVAAAVGKVGAFVEPWQGGYRVMLDPGHAVPFCENGLAFAMQVEPEVVPFSEQGVAALLEEQASRVERFLDLLHQEAVEQEWCGAYERAVREVGLEPRPRTPASRDIEVSVTFTYSMTSDSIVDMIEGIVTPEVGDDVTFEFARRITMENVEPDAPSQAAIEAAVSMAGHKSYDDFVWEITNDPRFL